MKKQENTHSSILHNEEKAESKNKCLKAKEKQEKLEKNGYFVTFKYRSGLSTFDLTATILIKEGESEEKKILEFRNRERDKKLSF